jgi:hypothetical protein
MQLPGGKGMNTVTLPLKKKKQNAITSQRATLFSEAPT